MLPFYGLFMIWALGAIHFSSPVSKEQEKLLFLTASSVTALMVGLRYEVGGDWETYLQMYESMYFQPLFFNLKVTDPAYGLLNWVSARFDGGVWPVKYVFYGTLTEPEKFADVLNLADDDIPQLQKAKLACRRIRMWRDKYRTLVDGGAEDEVAGWMYEVRNREEEAMTRCCQESWTRSLELEGRVCLLLVRKRVPKQASQF
ncbi:MAG: hypothetical protein EOO38_31900 [Cytophagaceae bacterium]|nr:MAG: hypothetical protein EOO38_31900 [Cytophagaceae bacterium]